MYSLIIYINSQTYTNIIRTLCIKKIKKVKNKLKNFLTGSLIIYSYYVELSDVKKKEKKSLKNPWSNTFLYFT